MIKESQDIDVRPTFCLVHGRYHDGWCWHLVQNELASAGWDSIAPTLPIEDPDMSLEDHAEVVRQAKIKSGVEESIDTGWSWGANIIPRAVGANAVKKLIFVAPSFHPATLRHTVAGEPLPVRSLYYEIWKRYEESAGFDLDAMKKFVSYAFYDDVENEELKNTAISRLREHPTRETEPELIEFPKLPLKYISTAHDHALVSEAQAVTARALGINPVRFNSGHTPMLSKPKELASVLIDLASRP